MGTQSITDNISTLARRVRLAAEKSQRKESDILVLAVSKTRPAEALREAYHCGLEAFGENYLNEALEKISALADLPLTWHFIGPIQSNKTRAIAENFDWVHSVDRVKIARRLSAQRPPQLGPIKCCIQVNISNEESKSGLAVSGVEELAREMLELPAIELRGLMAIPAATDDEDKQLEAFIELRDLMASLQVVAPDLDTLSMGMSGDLETAIEAGSTIVRVGTDIFGPRPT